MSIRRFAVYFISLMACCVTIFPHWGTETANASEISMASNINLRQKFMAASHRSRLIALPDYRHFSNDKARWLGREAFLLASKD